MPNLPPFRDKHSPTLRDQRARSLSDGRWRVEVLLFLGMLLVYQLSRAVVIGNPADAMKHAFEVINLEKTVGIFFEGHVQSAVLEHLHITQALNQFYIWAHLPLTAAFFIWLYRRRRTAYSFVRNAFFVANGLALAVFVVFPVAPPRMVHGQGFTDTLSLISGIDLHAGHLSGWFNPFAAVPSMHMAYALMVGLITAMLVRSWALRIVALLYPVVVFITIVGTANHYVLDAFAGGAVMVAAFVATGIVTRVIARRSTTGHLTPAQ